MTKLCSVVRHGDRLLSEPRPLGSGTGSITHDRFLTGAAQFRKNATIPTHYSKPFLKTPSPLKGRGVRRGFSMVEAVFCVVLVGGLVVVSLDTLGASKVAQRSLGDRTRGSLLASALMSGILNQSYEDPNQSPIWGLEAGENSLLRSTFDDVDDYINWSASPPQNRDGTSIPGLSGWRQSVTVDWVDQADLTTPWVPDTGVKRVTVTITHNNVVVATLVGVKTGTTTGLLPV